MIMIIISKHFTKYNN